MNKVAVEDLYKLIKFYEASFVVDHAASGIIMPSQQLFAAGLLNWINTPELANGLYYMKPVTDHLINSYEKVNDHPLSVAFELMYEDFWQSVLSERVVENDEFRVKSTRSRGYRGSNPVYAFLFIASAHGGAHKVYYDEMLMTFTHFAPYFFQKINKYKQSYSKTFIERISLVARKLVVASDSLLIVDSFTPDQSEKEQIGFAAFNATDYGEASLFEKSNTTYVSDLLFREGRKERDRSEHTKVSNGKTGRWSAYENGFRKLCLVEISNNDMEDKHFKTNGKNSISVSDFLELNLKELQEKIRKYGETIEDYIGSEGLEIPAHFFLDPWKSKQNKTHKMEAIVFSTRSQTWEKEVISKPVITQILHGLRTQKRAVKSIVLISLLMGFREGQLKLVHNIELPEYREVSSDGEQSRLSYKGFNYDKKHCVFWLHHQSVSRSDKFFMFEKQLKIPLPKELYQSLPNVEQGEKLFSAIDIREVKSFLKSFGRDGVGSVTIARLAKTFDAFFVESFGLPLLFVDILSGGERYYLKSQHFYVTQDLTHLTKQWHSFVQSFLDEYVGLTLLKIRNSPKEQFQLAQFKMTDNTKYIGAVNTPTKSALRQYFRFLFSRFPHTRNELIESNIHQWNAYVLYLYGLFSVCTGQRPRRDPMPDIKEISFEKRVIHITDKDSHMHREERCVPLVDTLYKALNVHQDLLVDWRTKVINDGEYELPGKPIFFPLFDKSSNNIIEATPATINHIMKGETNKNYIHKLNNGCRHFLLTSLFHHGLSQSDIDWVSGHRRGGMEAESIFSAMNWASTSELLKNTIELSIINGLKLEVPTHG